MNMACAAGNLIGLLTTRMLLVHIINVAKSVQIIIFLGTSTSTYFQTKYEPFIVKLSHCFTSIQREDSQVDYRS